MKVVVIFATLAVAILGHSSDFSIKLKHDGPTVVGGKINFIARLFEKKEPATGHFKFDWEDNTYGHHTATHESDSPVDVWSVSYPQEDVPLPGKYATTVTIHKQYHGLYTAVARLQIKFEIKGAKSDKHPHPILSQSWLDYKRDKILDSQARALNHIQDPRVKSIVSNRIDLINQRIPIMSTSYDTPKNEEKLEDKSDYLNNVINHKRQKILDSQQRELDHIWNPQVKSLVSNRIDYINSRIPIMQDSFAIPLEKHNKKIEELKEAEGSMIDSIQEPTVKEAVVGRIKEENKRVPYLSNANDVAARFSDALGAIHERMKEIEESRKQVLSTVDDAVKREEELQKVEEENKWLESRGKELDAQLAEALNNIHQKMVELKDIEAETLEGVDDPVEKQKVRVKLDTQNEKVATLLEDVPEEEYPVPLEEVSDKIRELEMAEWEAIECVKDPIVREIILSKLNEHNQEIPSMLKSSDVESKSLKSVSEVHDRINKEVEKVKDVPDDTGDLSTKAVVTERMAAEGNKRPEKSKEIDANLTASLTEVRNKIAALKVSEKKIVDSVSDSNKEEVANLVEEHNQRIPSLLLPSVIEANFTKALDKLNNRIANITDFMDFATANITNPFVLSMLQAKMALVNYKLVSKYNQIKDNFTALMDKMATETGDESNDAPTSDQNTEKVPKLMLGSGMVLPQLPNIIAEKIAMKLAPLGTLSSIATDPAIQNATLNKIAAKNQIIQAKANLIASNMAIPMALIRAKIAALQGLENSAVEGISDPAVREEVQTNIDEENRKVPVLLLPYGIESNFTSALNDFQDRINTIKNSVNTITGNITIPAIRSIISSKFDFVNQLLMNKYAQLDSNFTAIMSKIEERFANLTDKLSNKSQPDDGSKKVPILTKTSMGPAPTTFDLTKISDLIKNKMAAKNSFATSAAAGIPNPAIQAMVTGIINEKGKNMSLIADKLAVNFTKIMETINNKTEELQELESLTLDSIDDHKQQMEVLGQIEEENKKIPSLSLSKRGKKKDETEPDTSKPSMAKLKYPLIIRF